MSQENVEIVRAGLRGVELGETWMPFVGCCNPDVDRADARGLAGGQALSWVGRRSSACSSRWRETFDTYVTELNRRHHRGRRPRW